MIVQHNQIRGVLFSGKVEKILILLKRMRKDLYFCLWKGFSVPCWLMSQIRFTQHQLNCNLAFLTTFDLLKDKQNHQEVCNLAFLPITDVFIGIADYIMAITVFWSDGTVNLSNSTRPSNKQTQPNLNNSGKNFIKHFIRTDFEWSCHLTTISYRGFNLAILWRS